MTAAQVEAARALAAFCAVTAVQRHAGRLAHLYTPTGRQTVARGRDLTACRLLIGTGGALTRLPGGEAMLAATRGGGGDRLLPPAMRAARSTATTSWPTAAPCSRTSTAPP